MKDENDDFSGLTQLITPTVGDLLKSQGITMEGMLKAQRDIKAVNELSRLFGAYAFKSLVPPLVQRRCGRTQHLRDEVWRAKMLGMFPVEISPMYGMSAILDMLPSPRFVRLRRSLFLRTIGRRK